MQAKFRVSSWIAPERARDGASVAERRLGWAVWHVSLTLRLLQPLREEERS